MSREMNTQAYCDRWCDSGCHEVSCDHHGYIPEMAEGLAWANEFSIYRYGRSLAQWDDDKRELVVAEALATLGPKWPAT